MVCTQFVGFTRAQKYRLQMMIDSGLWIIIILCFYRPLLLAALKRFQLLFFSLFLCAQTSRFKLIVPSIFSCQLGKMYAVIGRRHGKILSADLMQGSGTFMVRAILPVIESYNFAQEIRKQTSGLAYPQLMFSHWEVSLLCMCIVFWKKERKSPPRVRKNEKKN